MTKTWNQEVFSKIVCPECAGGIDLVRNECGCGHYSIVNNVIIAGLRDNPEMACRDKQASGYVEHIKFPAQLGAFLTWLRRAIKHDKAKILELGCGPGPYTAILLNEGHNTFSINFSRESLLINERSCGVQEENRSRCFLQEDLNNIIVPDVGFDVVVMADFIQHLGGRLQREVLLKKAIDALKPGGHFYLTFFNINIKNYLRGDVHGGFSSGQIRYERLTPENVIGSLPAKVNILSVRPMNIVNSVYWLDRLLSFMPGSKYFSRMIEITGTKNAD